MYKKIKLICSKEQLNILLILFFGSIISTFFEFVGLGSIPLFAMMLLDIETFKESLPNFIDANFFDNFTQGDIAFYGTIILISIFVIKNSYLALMVYVQGKAIQSIHTNLAIKLFKSYINAPYSFHLQRNPAELLRSCTGDVSRVASVILSITNLFTESLILIMIFSLLFYADPFVSTYVFIFLIFFVGLFFLITKRNIRRRGQIVHKISAEQIKTVNETFGAVKEIKIFNLENYLEKIFEDNVNKIERSTLFNYFFTTVPRLFLEVISIITVVIILGTFVLMDRPITSIIPIISLIGISTLRLIPAFNKISTCLGSIKGFMPSFNFVYKELYNSKNMNVEYSKNKFSKVKFNKSIFIKNVSFNYSEKNISPIKDLELLIKCGTKIGCIGSSGAGKSTLVNLLLGLLKPSKGEILVDDINISQNLREWQNNIGYVPQDIFLFDDSIKNNILFGKEYNKELLKNVIKVSQIDQFVSELPQNLDTVIGNKGIRLSGGQRQRIGIARALYAKPELLVFDEATNSLDPENEIKIVNDINQDKSIKVFFIIAHKYETLKNCDFIIYLKDGKIFDQGKYDELNTKYNFNNIIINKKAN